MKGKATRARCADWFCRRARSAGRVIPEYWDYLRSMSKGICNPATISFRARAVLSGRCLGSPHMATWQIAQSGLVGVFGSNPHFTASLRSLTSRFRMNSNSPGSGSPAHPGSRRRFSLGDVLVLGMGFTPEE